MLLKTGLYNNEYFYFTMISSVFQLKQELNQAYLKPTLSFQVVLVEKNVSISAGRHKICVGSITGWEDALRRHNHSIFLPRIAQRKEPCGLQSRRSQRDWTQLKRLRSYIFSNRNINNVSKLYFHFSNDFLLQN